MPQVREPTNRPPRSRRVNVWLDNQLSPALARWIAGQFDVVAQSIRELGLSRASDPEIFFAAREAGAVVVTKDQDFVRLLERHGSPPRVIWITCGARRLCGCGRFSRRRFPRPLCCCRRASRWSRSATRCKRAVEQGNGADRPRSVACGGGWPPAAAIGRLTRRRPAVETAGHAAAGSSSPSR